MVSPKACSVQFFVLNFLCIFSNFLHTQVIIIGIAGGTGSGKTTLARQLEQTFGDDIVTISQDSYYKDLSHKQPQERALVNFDHPDALDFKLLTEHLSQLKQFLPIQAPCYDFKTHTRISAVVDVQPKHVIIVEGILLFTQEEIRNLLDLRIFIDTPDDMRLLRRIFRDINERGRSLESISRQYLASVKPMHDQFIAPSRQHAQLIISGAFDNAVAIDTIIAKIRQDLQRLMH